MRKIIISIYLVTIILICSGYFLLDKKSNINNISLMDKTIKVDLKGAVVNPGVKEVLIGTTVDDLIKDSGGLLEYADTSTINLSKKLSDEDVVIVYTKDEIKNNNIDIKIIDRECICPVVTNNVCINNEFTKIVLDTKISLNSSSKEDLMTLPGIGSSKAEAIIEYRSNNIFNTIEDIKNVKGIGQALFDKIKDYITI